MLFRVFCCGKEVTFNLDVFKKRNKKIDTHHIRKYNKHKMSTLCIANNVLMVGDSVYDFEGAVKVGVDFIGVLYGFGFKKEDVEFYSSKIEFIREPKELLNLVTTEIVK